jgi:predicted  nucleic acid-binding Zn-ribbon protein
MTTWYEILEIDESATQDDIKKAYQKLAQQWHPDKWNTKSLAEKEEANKKMQEINRAYEILSKSGPESAQQWLDKNHPRQQFSSQSSPAYTVLSSGRIIYDDPPRSAPINPRTSLEVLDIKNKNLRGSLSLVDFANLQVVNLSGNKITSLDLSGCPNLRVIRCDNNPITNLKFINRSSSSVVEIHFSQDELIRDKKKFEELSEKLSVELSREKSQVSSLKNSKNSLESTVKDLEGQKSYLNQQVQKLNQELTNNRERITRLETSSREYWQQWENSKKEVNDLTNKLNQIEIEKSNLENELLQKRISLYETQQLLGQSRSETNRRGEKIEEQKKLLEGKDNELKRQLRINNQITQERDQKEAEVNAWKTQLTEEKTISTTLRMSNKSMKDENTNLRSNLETEQRNVQTLQEQINQVWNQNLLRQLETRRDVLIATFQLDEQQVSSLQEAQEQAIISEQANAPQILLTRTQRTLNRVKSELSRQVNPESLQELCDIFSQLVILQEQPIQGVHNELELSVSRLDKSVKAIQWKPEELQAPEQFSSNISTRLLLDYPSIAITNPEELVPRKSEKDSLKDKQNELNELIIQLKTKLNKKNSSLIDELLKTQREIIKTNNASSQKKLDQLKSQLTSSRLSSLSKKLDKEEVVKLLTKHQELINLELELQWETKTELPPLPPPLTHRY